MTDEYPVFNFRNFTCKEDIVASLRRYADKGIPTGDFLKAMLSNDLSGAMHRADPDNLDNLQAIFSYMHNKIPAGCWGSPEAYKIHLKRFKRFKRERENESK